MKKFVFLLVLIGCLSVGAYFYIDTESPEILFTIQDGDFVNKAFNVHLEDNVALDEACYSLSGGACTGNQICSFGINASSLELQIDPETCSVNSEPLSITINISASDTSLITNKSEQNFKIIFDNVPPNLTSLGGTRYLKQGGSGVVLYEVLENPVKTGVVLEDWSFQAYELEPNKFLSFYAHPYSIEADSFKPRIFASDAAGNIKKIRPGSRTSSNKYRSENLELSDNFLETVKDKMMASSSLSPLEAFIEINNNLRQENNRAIAQICQKSENKQLWSGSFIRNQGAPKAGFADARTYLYQSKVVSQQVHTGLDIAGINNTEIIAANSGKVVFTGDLGIYGNVVIIDHGFGLHSLYGHLSQVLIKENDEVAKGEVIAISGETGLAFGDHLHFEIRVNGMAVNPIEWLDPDWVASHIEPFMPSGKVPNSN